MAAPTIIMAVASVIQAVGAVSKANSESASMNQQAQAYDYNAAVSKQQAEHSLQVGTAQQLDQRRKARMILGQQRAAAAQSKTGERQADDLLEQSETLAELDALNIAYDGMLKSRGYTTQAELDTYQAASYRANAKAVRRSGYLSALGSLASGGASIYQAGGTTNPTPKTTVGGGYVGLRPTARVGFTGTGGSGLRF